MYYKNILALYPMKIDKSKKTNKIRWESLLMSIHLWRSQVSCSHCVYICLEISARPSLLVPQPYAGHSLR